LAVAVSGGADSMALLWLMAAPEIERPPWAPEVVAAHVNHGLRGAESDADERRAALLARALGVEFRCRRLDGERLRRSAAGSLENAARRARYAALKEIARRSRCDALALAHHQDDLAETFLMRLLRGSGLMGLGGFGPEAEIEGVAVVRPLIGWTRAAVRAAARAARLDWGEDATNRDLRLMRNRIRRRILPYLERTTNHAGVISMLARTARRLEREGRALHVVVARLYGRARRERSRPRRIGIARKDLARGASERDHAVFAPYLLRLLMCDVLETAYPPSEERLMELLDFALAAKPGALMQTAGNVVVWMSRDEVLWAYRKTRRKIERRHLIEIFSKP
jgi:tRNA(Ile)-lysidine synthetase-like protein